jgi:hypothetical protein
MSALVRQKILESRDIFRSIVWPIWREALGAVELISTEGSEKAFEQRADTGGIDGFFARRPNGVIIPLASRIEYAWAKDIETSRGLDPRFTIRSAKWDGCQWSDATELRRLIEASKDEISRRYLPFRTFQSLVSKDHTQVLFSSAICTLKLCDYINTLFAQGRGSFTTTKSGDARFLEIKVKDLRRAGVEVESIRL